MNTINVQTPIPGPRSRQALDKQLAQESTAVSYPKRLPISLAKGLGCYVQDLDGNVFIDFLAGAGSLPLGHSHPDLVAEVVEQAGTLCLGLDFPTPTKERFTDAHLGMLPEAIRGDYRMHFCGPTGADAWRRPSNWPRPFPVRMKSSAFEVGTTVVPMVRCH